MPPWPPRPDEDLDVGVPPTHYQPVTQVVPLWPLRAEEGLDVGLPLLPTSSDQLLPTSLTEAPCCWPWQM